MSEPLTLGVPRELVRAIAEDVASLLLERLPQRPEPYLDVGAAAEYLAAPKSRIYDLVARGRLTPYRDGQRLLFRRENLDLALTRPVSS